MAHTFSEIFCVCIFTVHIEEFNSQVREYIITIWFSPWPPAFIACTFYIGIVYRIVCSGTLIYWLPKIFFLNNAYPFSESSSILNLCYGQSYCAALIRFLHQPCIINLNLLVPGMQTTIMDAFLQNTFCLTKANWYC